MHKYLLLVAIPLVLGGCASEPVDHCRLGKHEPGCYSMEQVYNKAVHTPGNVTSIQEIMRKNPAQPAPPPALPAPVGYNSGYADPGVVGEPVFRQPRVYRVWIAPYVDADGNLRSGEYAYFSTPGQWSYGSLRTPGSASAGTMFAPAKSNVLGFRPNLSSGPKAPPIPQGEVQQATPIGPSSITPPAVKLTQ